MKQALYWISIKDYFNDSESYKDRKVKFQRIHNKFNTSCKDDLIKLAKPDNYGLYIAPPPVKETLYSNLLKVTFPVKLFVATSKYSSFIKIISTLRLQKVQLPSEWIFSNNLIVSFHNLRDELWNKISEIGTVEIFDTSDWAYADCEDKRKVFVWLLNKCLNEKVKNDLDYCKEKKPHYYYFRHTPDLSILTYAYQGIQKRTSRDVFKAYTKKNGDFAYYRHSGFQGYFQLFDNTWYLEISPTYHFSNKDKQKNKFSGSYLSGIKNIEGNDSVRGQVIMWADFLRGAQAYQLEIEGKLLPEYEFIRFGELMTFELNVGINDDLWQPQKLEVVNTHHDPDNTQNINGLPLFGQENYEN
jgi:hypothetical protein